MIFGSTHIRTLGLLTAILEKSRSKVRKNSGVTGDLRLSGDLINFSRRAALQTIGVPVF
jgi:hypothetical protein